MVFVVCKNSITIMTTVFSDFTDVTEIKNNSIRLFQNVNNI